MPAAERVIGPFTNNDMAQKRRAQRAKSVRNASARGQATRCVPQGLEAWKADALERMPLTSRFFECERPRIDRVCLSSRFFECARPRIILFF